jgi:hypothetical protein
MMSAGLLFLGLFGKNILAISKGIIVAMYPTVAARKR